MVAICVSTNCTRTTTVGYISVCLFLCACGESSHVSGTEIHPVTPHVFLASPSGVNALPRHIYQRTDKCPDVLSAISAPHPLSVSQLEPPPRRRHSSSLSLLLSSFLPDYISGDFDSITAEVRTFFAAKVSGTWFAHTLLQVYTQKCIEIKAKGLQTNIIKFELSSGGRLAAPLILSSLARCPTGLPGAGTCMIGYSWYLMGPSCELVSATRVWMRSQTWMRSSLGGHKYITTAQFPLWTYKPVFFCNLPSD